MNKTSINYAIRSPNIRVIHDGKQVGVMSKQDALSYAKNLGMDLIEIAKQNNVSICLVADYGRYKYEQDLREKQKRKNQVFIEEKELWFSPNTQQHDIDVQINKLKEYIDKGFNVRLTVRAKKGKFQPHKDKWFELINGVLNQVNGFVDVLDPPSLNGQRVSTKVSPKKQVVQ